jgi:hypothetical protein
MKIRRLGSEYVPLVEAAREARVSYLVMRDIAMRGEVCTRRDRKGHWYCHREDVRHLAARRREAGTVGASATTTATAGAA